VAQPFPHARLPLVKWFFAIMARLQKPLDFDAIDGHDVDIGPVARSS
jgi:mannitol/fructose-specific phosphotransferase system IIA component (Ntr-type)